MVRKTYFKKYNFWTHIWIEHKKLGKKWYKYLVLKIAFAKIQDLTVFENKGVKGGPVKTYISKTTKPIETLIYRIVFGFFRPHKKFPFPVC